MIIKYVNSAGKTIMMNSNELKIKQANFHDYEWKYKSINKKRGIYVNEFQKTEAKYQAKLCAYGSINRRKEIFNNFLEITEYDVERKKPGKLYYGDYYLECFVIKSSTEPTKNYESERSIIIMGPSNEWVKEKTFRFGISLSDQTLENINSDYPRDYPYDYASNISAGEILNESYNSEDFRMTIYGPSIDPWIKIGKNIYQIYTEIMESEYLIIDSRDQTVIQYDRTGGQEIKFNSRNKKYKIFEKIPIGSNAVECDGGYGIDIIIYEKRSEPKWIIQ